MTCPSCQTPNKEGARFCVHCGTTLQIAAAGPAPQSVRAPRHAPAKPVRQAGKSPAVAAVLSLLIVGAGQFYNQDVKKGVLMLGGALVLGLLIPAVGWFAIAIWSAIDAHQVAGGKRAVWA